jgi:hypothetical protein
MKGGMRDRDDAGRLADEASRGILEELLGELDERSPVPAAETTLVGECIDDRHPTLLGRVEIRVQSNGRAPVDTWLATLRGVSVRVGDRVWLQRAANWPEPVVVGVLDGFEARPIPERKPAATLELRADETVAVLDSRGRPLLEIGEGEHGPSVRLSQPNLELDVPGDLRMRADSIRLTAAGPIEIDADGDVVVRGDVIELN